MNSSEENVLSTGRGPTLRLVDERLITALSHETRAHALTVFTERPASTKEIAEELGQSVSAVWYHVDRLFKLGCIEEVESKRRRGARERFFRATVRHYFDDEMWEGIPQPRRLVIAMGILGLISGDVSEAAKSETVDTIDNHLTRTLLMLDRVGWDEASGLLNDTLEGLLSIRERAVLRLGKSEDRPIRTSVSIMQFELPPRSGS